MSIKTIRKRIWTGDTVSPTDMAEHARDVAAAVEEVDGKLTVVTVTGAWTPPLMIDTQGRFPAAVIGGTAQRQGFTGFSAISGLSWDYYNSQVRVLDATGFVKGSVYTISILLFFGSN